MYAKDSRYGASFCIKDYLTPPTGSIEYLEIGTISGTASYKNEVVTFSMPLKLTVYGTNANEYLFDKTKHFHKLLTNKQFRYYNILVNFDITLTTNNNWKGWIDLFISDVDIISAGDNPTTSYSGSFKLIEPGSTYTWKTGTYDDSDGANDYYIQLYSAGHAIEIDSADVLS